MCNELQPQIPEFTAYRFHALECFRRSYTRNIQLDYQNDERETNDIQIRYNNIDWSYHYFVCVDYNNRVRNLFLT